MNQIYGYVQAHFNDDYIQSGRSFWMMSAPVDYNKTNPPTGTSIYYDAAIYDVPIRINIDDFAAEIEESQFPGVIQYKLRSTATKPDYTLGEVESVVIAAKERKIVFDL